MNNKERYIWIGIFTLSAMFCDRKIAQIEGLEMLNNGNKFNSEIKSDQINELILKVNESNSDGYQRGFEDGKAHAMIAAVNKSSVYGYSEGYHAAIKQLSEEGLDSSDIKNLKYVNNLIVPKNEPEEAK
tara:strand:- start:6748 stop:7134 length:387 start_codon:yes stop_codon:yes gene_type:complete